MRGFRELSDAKQEAQRKADKDQERYFVWLDSYDHSYTVKPHFAKKEWMDDRKIFEAEPSNDDVKGCTIWLTREEWTIVADVLNVEEEAYGVLEPTKKTLRKKIRLALGIPA